MSFLSLYPIVGYKGVLLHPERYRMKPFIYLIPLFILAWLVTPSPSHAQQSGYVGMHHLKTKAAPAPAIAETPDPEEEETTTTAQPLPVYRALSLKDALIKQEDLEKWDHMSEAALATSDKDIQNLIHVIESDRGAVPPQGLFLAAKSLADKHMMEQAAVYYFVGQLRLNFDMARWPAIQNKDDVKRLAEEHKKSPDQMSPNLDTEPRINDPHQGIRNLADQIGAPIISWVLKDPARMNKMIAQTKEWDISSPYEYLPDYDLTDAVPFNKWDKLLTKNRELYFTQIVEWAKIMSKVRR